MKENAIVSSRGQITLPAKLRRRLGIKLGDVVTLEERTGQVILKPAAALETAVYSDEEIARWDEEDRFEEGEREAILSRLRG